jgi:superfamily II DNA or RNA helicase
MKGKFALTLTTHRILGPIFNAVVIIHTPNREYFTVTDRISLANLKLYEEFLAPEQISIVRIIEEYSDNQLLKKFSKKKTRTQDFLNSVDETIYERQVRPYIERRLLRCIEQFSGGDTPVYLKKQLNNIYEADRIWLQDDTANAVFNFIRNPEGIQYYLTVSYNDEIIRLTGKKGFVLTNDPCRLILENRIFQFDDIDGKKLLPFFKRHTITIRAETERKFLETFAKPVIQKYQVHATGFTITDKHLQPNPTLSLETNLSGMPVLMLRFGYGEKAVYYAGKKSELLVTMAENENQIEFFRLPRNFQFENHVVSSLLELGLANLDASSFAPLRLKRSENIFLFYDLVSWLNLNSTTLKQLGINVLQAAGNNRYYLQQVELKLEVTENKNDWFDIFAVVQFAGFEIPFIRFRSHILDGRREFELPDGQVVVLPEEWFARFRELFTFARDHQDQLILERQHFPLLKEGLHGLNGSYGNQLRKLLNSSLYEEQQVPGEIQASLRDYQKKGYSWMWKLYTNEFGGCLADDMGLGKTLQTLTLIQQVVNHEKTLHCGPAKSVFDKQLTIFDSSDAAQVKAKPSLVIVPSTLMHNWINEAVKFAPSLKTGFYGGQNRKPFRYYYENYDLIITSYGLARNDLETLKSYEFLYIVLDESQVIKNPHAKTYKAVISLIASNRLVLTGTPIENSLTDLWAQMNFLNPGLLGNFEFFRNQFVTPIEKGANEKQSQILQTLIKPFVLRRTKKEVAKELPALTQQVIYCEMSESQQNFYETEKSKARNLILDNIHKQGIEKSSFVILQSLTKLRQVANHPVMIEKGYSEDSGKHDVIIDNLESLIAEGHKALIFSSFVKHLELFTAYCDARGIRYSLLTGDIPQPQREAVIRKFQDNADVHLFFISIKAGGFGLNLTSADYVFILDPWWNPAVEEQAMSRAHRMGQKKNVFVYRFITRNTLEEKIHFLQEKKSQLAENFINDNNPFLAGDKEELLKLLE